MHSDRIRHKAFRAEENWSNGSTPQVDPEQINAFCAEETWNNVSAPAVEHGAASGCQSRLSPNAQSQEGEDPRAMGVTM